jgi:Uncharacterised protein conserved in bacteria (DUF2336)
MAGLVARLDVDVAGGPQERCVQILRQVMDLYLPDADRLNETQVAVFDDVFVQLIEKVETRTLAQLSNTLSEVDRAPREVVRQLAFHDDASVAAPVLTKSNRLSETDLVEIANTRGQQHLLALSGREALEEALTDVLIARGSSAVTDALAKNLGARFSAEGYATLRTRLLKTTPSRTQQRIQAAIAAAVQTGAPAPNSTDYSQAKNQVAALNRAGKLSDSTVNRFAVGREYTNVVAAIALLSEVTIEVVKPLIENGQLDGLIIACKAARLSWSTTSMIIRNRPGCLASEQEFDRGQDLFETLPLSIAQRTIRFGSVQSAPKQ